MTGVLISASAGFPQFSSDKYFEFLSDRLFAPISASSHQSTPLSWIRVSADKRGLQILRHDQSVSTALVIGVVLHSTKSKAARLDHIVSIGGTRMTGTYTSSRAYFESVPLSWSANIRDTLDNKYVQNALSLDYQLRWTYDQLWFAVGIGMFMNKVRLVQEGTCHVEGGLFSEGPPYTLYSYTTPSSSTSTTSYVSVPIEINIGWRLRTGKIDLLPSLGLAAFAIELPRFEGYIVPCINLGLQYHL